MTTEAVDVDRTQDEIVAAIITALEAVLERELDGVTSDSRLFDELGLDSTGVLDLMMQLEETLGVEFDTDRLEMSHFATVGALAEYVRSVQGE